MSIFLQGHIGNDVSSLITFSDDLYTISNDKLLLLKTKFLVVYVCCIYIYIAFPLVILCPNGGISVMFCTYFAKVVLKVEIIFFFKCGFSSRIWKEGYASLHYVFPSFLLTGCDWCGV
jgi:hypothetical protein